MVFSVSLHNFNAGPHFGDYEQTMKISSKAPGMQQIRLWKADS